MKKFIIFIANLTRVIGGLVAFLIMLIGVNAAWKELWDWLRRKKMDKNFSGKDRT